MLLVTGGCVEEQGWTPLARSYAAPDFTLPKLGGGEVTLSALRGQVVVIEFWATWCGPCRMSTPSVDAVYRRLKDRGVTALLINVGEAQDEIVRWDEKRFQATILMDQDKAVSGQYALVGIPTLLVVDQAGQVVHRHSGYGGALEKNLSQALEALLAAPPTGSGHGGA